MAVPVQVFVDQLTPSHRVLVIGGLAVIAHGYDRHTTDANVWLEPLSSPEDWARAVADACSKVPPTTMHRLPGWTEVRRTDLAQAIVETGMVRIRGLERPLDIFRRPNEFDEQVFEEVFSRARQISDGTWLIDPLDLIQTKLDTGRTRDQKDIIHLEQVVRADYLRHLPTASPDEARAMLERYSEWQVLRAAKTNPDPEVQELAMSHLHEFADAGDPFSQAILEGRDIPLDDQPTQ